MSIHPTAVIAESAALGADVAIGPFVVIEENAVIGDRTILDPAAQVRRDSVVGPDCRIGSGAIVGADPQFLGFDTSIRSRAEMGQGNILREYVTVHRSIHEGEATRIGDENYLMTGVHLGHDCIVGNRNTMANNALLGGHVTFGDNCFVGGGAVFHQYVRVGDYVMIQGLSGFSLDLPPYVIGAGVNYVAGINSVGLRRAGFGNEARRQIKDAYHLVYRSGKPLKEALAEAQEQDLLPETSAFFDFFRQESKKGFCIRVSRD